MATRRFRETRVDHGAQFFTARDPRFQAHVDSWIEQGWVKKWFQNSPVDQDPAGHPRYCGLQGISDVPKRLATSFPCLNQAKVDRIDRGEDRWRLYAQGHAIAEAHWVLLTAPLPQTIDLMDQSSLALPFGESDRWRELRYERGFAVLVELDQPSTIPNSGAWPVTDSEILTWVADNQKKGISPNKPALTLHTHSIYAQAHWEHPDSKRIPPVLEAAKRWMPGEVVHAEGHRWGFTKPINPLPYRTWVDDRGLAFAGDAFGGPRVEGAALSGIETGVALAERIGNHR